MFHVKHGAVRRSRKIAKLAFASLAACVLVGGTSAAAATAAAQSNPPHSAVAPILALPSPDIAIVPGSVINLVAHDSRIPVAIRNNYDTEVKVLVRVAPNNFTVTIPGAVLVSVPAQTTVHAEVPVQAIANGPVSLDAWLTTTTGIQIGKTVHLAMNVNADVESVILLSFAALLVLLIAIGLPRTLRKRRLKAEEAA